jgi:ATP-dependent helicase HrpB
LRFVLSFDPFKIDLPVTEIISDVRNYLSAGNTLIVNAPPGAGKSTLLPLALLKQEWRGEKKIIMLEPRRLAARSIAARMSQLLEEEVGETVGYRIRFENRVGKKTEIEVVTEGILTRMLQSDNALENVGLVIFDEFHERSLHADVALALCREAQQVLRPDLRILVMSATLNMPQLKSLLGALSVVSQGRQYPVEISYASENADEIILSDVTARTVMKALKEREGDILAFLPGEGEIRKCEEILKAQSGNFLIHPLYGQLSSHEQNLAIMPNRSGKRKVVLATSIAETSLTIEGIKIVVDCGYGRTSRFDPASGLTRLETVRISKDSADQRAGRAGRLSAGFCYRMWTRATHERLAEHRVPEILEADLTSLMLDMVQWGVSDIQQLCWLTPPPKAALAQASDLLHALGALENGKITPHGKQIHSLACHPRLAHMLLMAKEERLVQLGCDISALLEERDPLTKESGIDINLRIEALRRARKSSGMNNRMVRIEKAAASFRKMLSVQEDNGPVDPYESGLLLAYAYPERIACAKVGNNAPFQLANGKIAMAGHQDDLAHEPWLAVATMDARDGNGKIFLASPLNPKDLLPMVKEQQTLVWDTRKGGLIATKDMKIGSIVLQSKPLASPDEERVAEIISEAIKSEGANLLSFGEKMEQLQNRIRSLKVWNLSEEWPNVDTEHLLETNKEWLGPFLKNARRTEDLKKIDLAEALLNSFDWQKREQLDKLAPGKIEVPTGSKITLHYHPNGAAPVLKVRLQEVFGMVDTPRVNNGKISVVMHLLSPGYKPVQVTSDLRSFWSNMYFEVKKELQRKYPKHSWPDDPWKAQPVKKGSSEKR